MLLHSFSHINNKCKSYINIYIFISLHIFYRLSIQIWSLKYLINYSFTWECLSLFLSLSHYISLFVQHIVALQNVQLFR